MQAPKFHVWTSILGILSALVTAISFYPALSNGFVDWDDMGFIVDNIHIRRLGCDQIRWMFTNLRMGPYQPVPWLTFALDYKLSGLDPFRYHLTSLLWHVATTLGFFAVARRLLNTGRGCEASWHVEIAAAIATIMFAAHPLRVESVVWASERRDVVSGFFLVLSVWAYLRAVSGRRSNLVSLPWMLASLLLYTLSSCSKATGMCLPLVLIILDVYPLGRFRDYQSMLRDPAARRIWFEKIPFCLLSIAFGVTALIGQVKAGAITPVESYGVTARLAFAGFASIFYVIKTFLPFGLSPLYEVPTDFRPWHWQFMLSGLAAVVLTLGIFSLRRRWPALHAAWFSYLVLLAPVSGLAQAGMQIAADRYTYIPCMSFAILLGAVYAWWEGGRSLRGGHSIVPGLIALLALSAVLAPLTWMQSKVWQNTRTLWTKALEVNPKSSMAHNNAAMALLREQRFAEAYRLLQTALQLRPDNGDAHNNIAVALRRMGKPYEAMEHYLEAERANARPAEVQHNIGLLLAEEPYLERLGFSNIEQQWESAVARFKKSLELKPDYVNALNDLGILCKKMGRLDESVRYYQQAIELDPDLHAAHYNLANVLAAQGEDDAAIAEYRRVLQKEPGHLQASINLANLHERRREYGDAVAILRVGLRRAPENDLLAYNLCWLLAAAPDPSVRNGQEAVALASHLDRKANGMNPRVLDVLAAGLAETGQFQDAERQALRAYSQAIEQGLSDLAEQIQNRVTLYRSGVPFRSHSE
jgi:tetratricopeptide (TPR) repeat protein